MPTWNQRECGGGPSRSRSVEEGLEEGLVGVCQEAHELTAPEPSSPLVKEPFNHELLSWLLFVSVITAITMDAAKVSPGAAVA